VGGEEWVEQFLDQRGEDDAGKGVEGVDGVIGDAGELHLPRLRDEIVLDLVEAHVEDCEAEAWY